MRKTRGANSHVVDSRSQLAQTTHADDLRMTHADDSRSRLAQMTCGANSRE